MLRDLRIVSHCVTFWHLLTKIKMRRPLGSFVSFKMMIERTDKEGKGKEYMEEVQCAQKGGRMLVSVICGFIKNF